MSRKAVLWTVAVVVVLVAAMAYGSSREAAVQQSETATSDLAASMLEAYNTGDYLAFSSSFTNAFVDEMDEASFQAWRTPLIASIGLYQEIIDETVTDTAGGEANRHVFHASFENDESVQFAIVFKSGTDRINRVEMKPDK